MSKQIHVVLFAKLTNGKKVVTNNLKKEQVTLYVDSQGNSHWLTNEAIQEMSTNPIGILTVAGGTGKVANGDAFVATRDSKRTKLMGWLTANPGKTEADCPIDKAVQNEPLYLAGDTVAYREGSFVLSGFTTIEQVKAQKELAALNALA